MRLIQLLDEAGNTRVGVVDAQGGRVRLLDGVDSTYALAGAAIAAGRSLDAQAAATAGDATLDYPALLQAGRVLSPLHHPDPAHCLVTGTGLTHLGSAAARDAMHQNLRQQADAGTLACLEAGPFSDTEVATAEAALQTAAPIHRRSQ